MSTVKYSVVADNDPEVAFYVSYTGPRLLSAAIIEPDQAFIPLTNMVVIEDMTSFVADLYGPEFNWHKKNQNVAFASEYIGKFLRLDFDTRYNDPQFCALLIESPFISINPPLGMPDPSGNNMFP